MNEPLKYIGYTVAFQEVPNEVSLVFNISGCPHKCGGCHSKHLWEYEGNYLKDDIENVVNQYKNMITCVCFMGGDQSVKELLKYLKYVKDMGLKTCLYSGSDSSDHLASLLERLDYLKVGSYHEECGGLNSASTNQKMFQINELNLIDITHLFQLKHE